MARSGGRSQWEREMAAQRREADRQAREQARLAEKEKARQQRPVQAQLRAAERKTAGIESRSSPSTSIDRRSVIASADVRQPEGDARTPGL